ncbi:single-stranded DNA-binding protein [Caldifermentibacillus hisashii]|uniref:Single-stranded DNA-binding protein n=2 Tax=Caldifermentibacillus hisashii TaxID=996558 RepID=A0ABU9K353_9BACI|nr:single-stranded DNA-binding protein [Caldibacillus thermoamylovorans]
MLNNCVFVGRLSSEVELKYTPNGHPVAVFNLALTRAIPDKNGEKKADFIRCVAWGKVAENMANQLSKGDTIGIQTRVQTRNYENQQGQKVYVTEFIVEGFPTFIKVKKWESGNGNSAQKQKKSEAQNFPTADPFFGYGQGQPIDINDDDLPF